MTLTQIAEAAHLVRVDRNPVLSRADEMRLASAMKNAWLLEEASDERWAEANAVVLRIERRLDMSREPLPTIREQLYALETRTDSGNGRRARRWKEAVHRLAGPGYPPEQDNRAGGAGAPRRWP